MNFPTWPHYEDDEILAATQVLKSGKVNYWTGQICKSFEKSFAKFLNINHAITVANGSVGLDAALYSLELNSGDEVILPCRTFIATASSVALNKATPVMADIDFNTQNITITSIKKVFTNKTKGIIIVHIAGMPCDMDPILEFAKANNLWVIEDCAQALGAKYKGKSVGTLGDIGIFSFCQDKIISTGGEGGMVVTNSDDLWDKIWAYKDHGKSIHELSKNHPVGYRFVHTRLGTNYRMTEFQASIGEIQLKKLPKWLDIRKSNAEILNKYVDELESIDRTYFSYDCTHVYYQYYVHIKLNKLINGCNRDTILLKLNELGIPCKSGICPDLSKELVFNSGTRTQGFSNAKRLGECSLMFSLHHMLDETHVHKIGAFLQKVMNESCK